MLALINETKESVEDFTKCISCMLRIFKAFFSRPKIPAADHPVGGISNARHQQMMFGQN